MPAFTEAFLNQIHNVMAVNIFEPAPWNKIKGAIRRPVGDWNATEMHPVQTPYKTFEDAPTESALLPNLTKTASDTWEYEMWDGETLNITYDGTDFFIDNVTHGLDVDNMTGSIAGLTETGIGENDSYNSTASGELVPTSDADVCACIIAIAYEHHLRGTTMERLPTSGLRD